MIKNLVLDCDINPNQLNSNYKDIIYDILKNMYEKKSIKSGYIISINKIKDFIHNNINNGVVSLKLLCECDVYKPIIDDTVNCKVEMIHINGIFVTKYNIKILIPNTLNIFEIRNNKCIYNEKEINIGDNIDITIKQIRFDNLNFTCIGDIV